MKFCIFLKNVNDDILDSITDLLNDGIILNIYFLSQIQL